MNKLSGPLTAQLELTEACNCLCKHCYNYWRYTQTGKILSKDDGSVSDAQLQQILRVLIDNGVFKVTFTGGEPFLRRVALTNLVEQAKKSGLHVGINSNAVLIGDKDVEMITYNKVDSVLVSLISGKEATHNLITGVNSYKRTVDGIKRLVDGGVNVTVNMVVSQPNFATLEETVEFVTSIGVKSFAATPVLACPFANSHLDMRLTSEQIKHVVSVLFEAKKLGINVDILEPIAHCLFSQEELDRYGQLLQHRYCCAGITDMAVSPTGDTRPCVLSHQISGNLLVDGWKKCWEEMGLWRTPDILPAICQTCNVVDYCGGGCRVSALSQSGSLNSPDPNVTQPIVDTNYLFRKGSGECVAREVDDSQKYTTAQNIRRRSEEFGGVLFLDNSFTFLSEEGYHLFEDIVNTDSFSLADLVSQSVTREAAVGFVSYLLNKGLAIAKEA
jgi:radical SAM protein with 4Fe4S-binding SPASM domain